MQLIPELAKRVQKPLETKEWDHPIDVPRGQSCIHLEDNEGSGCNSVVEHSNLECFKTLGSITSNKQVKIQ